MKLPAHPFFIALQFLTILPVHLKDQPTDKDMGRSILYYPVIGAVIGGLLGLTLLGLNSISVIASGVPLVAALVLLVWVLLTGGLHLDGLADSADALMGGFGDRQKTLDIMKDPVSGPMGILSLILVLLIKFSALWQLTIHINWLPLLIAPILSRSALIALFLTTPYVRKKGLGSQIKRYLPKEKALANLIVVLVIVAVLTQMSALWIFLIAGACFTLMRAIMMQRLGGTTGDTAGALVEVSETAILVVLALTTR